MFHLEMNQLSLNKLKKYVDVDSYNSKDYDPLFEKQNMMV